MDSKSKGLPLSGSVGGSSESCPSNTASSAFLRLPTDLGLSCNVCRSCKADAGDGDRQQGGQSRGQRQRQGARGANRCVQPQAQGAQARGGERPPAGLPACHTQEAAHIERRARCGRSSSSVARLRPGETRGLLSGVAFHMQAVPGTLSCRDSPGVEGPVAGTDSASVPSAPRPPTSLGASTSVPQGPPAPRAPRGDATCTQLHTCYEDRTWLRERQQEKEELRQRISGGGGGAAFRRSGSLRPWLRPLPAGMLNLGNTCYLNAVLQVCAMLRMLQNALQALQVGPTQRLRPALQVHSYACCSTLSLPPGVCCRCC